MSLSSGKCFIKHEVSTWKRGSVVAFELDVISSTILCETENSLLVVVEVFSLFQW